MRLIDADELKVDYIVPSTSTNTSCYRYVSKEQIDNAPTIEPKNRCKYWDGESGFCALQRPADLVKHGKWLPHPTEPDWDVCSVCGIGTHRRFHYNDAVYGEYDVEESFTYCPHCGAKLDREIHDHYNCTGCGFMSTCTDEEAQQCLKPHISQ